MNNKNNKKQLNVILKTGSTLPFIAKKYGDFEHWIIKGTGAPENKFSTVSIHDSMMPGLDITSSILITGSHSMLTQDCLNPVVVNWIKEAVTRHIPVLGICYGHHLLAHAMNGKVNYLKCGKEIGTVPVTLTDKAKDDRLFSIMPPEFFGHASHAQTVTKLPPGATCLAFSVRDSHQAFVINESAWGVQFHPEFNAEVMKLYIEHYQQNILKHEHCSDAFSGSVKDTPHSFMLLKRFYDLAEVNDCKWKAGVIYEN